MCGRFHEPHPQSSCLAECRALRSTLRAFRLREGEPSLGKECQSGRRELDAARYALEQGRADLPLKILDLAAQWRLCDVQSLRRPPEMHLFGDGNEIAE